MVICPDCKSEVPDEKFCKNCGAYLKNEIKTPVKSKYCANCGSELEGDVKFCANCGYDIKNRIKKPAEEVQKKNIIVAIILSVFLPGLGQIYLGLDRKGGLFLVSYIISAVLIFIIIGFLLVTVIWIWALVDSIQSCNAINRGEKVEDKLL